MNERYLITSQVQLLPKTQSCPRGTNYNLNSVIGRKESHVCSPDQNFTQPLGVAINIDGQFQLYLMFDEVDFANFSIFPPRSLTLLLPQGFTLTPSMFCCLRHGPSRSHLLPPTTIPPWSYPVLKIQHCTCAGIRPGFAKPGLQTKLYAYVRRLQGRYACLTIITQTCHSFFFFFFTFALFFLPSSRV